MKLVCGSSTSVPVLGSVRQAATILENASGTISAEDRSEFMAALNALLTIMESHCGGVF